MCKNADRAYIIVQLELIEIQTKYFSRTDRAYIIVKLGLTGIRSKYFSRIRADSAFLFSDSKKSQRNVAL